MPEPTAPETPQAAPAPTAAPAQPAPPKIKPKKVTQRACDEKDEKGKLCCGHLKRWYDYPKEFEALVGPKAEIYRCEFCKTLYKPDTSQPPHSYTLRY
jgi:hypothetical protein